MSERLSEHDAVARDNELVPSCPLDAGECYRVMEGGRCSVRYHPGRCAHAGFRMVCRAKAEQRGKR